MKQTVLCATLCLTVAALGCRSSYHNDDSNSAQRSSHTADSAENTTKTKSGPSTQLASEKQARDASASVSNAAATAEDRQFVEQAVQGGKFEIESSRIAVSKAVSDALRNFADTMIEDHSSLNGEIESIARSKGVAVPASLDSEHQRDLDDLRDLSGATFDSKFHALQVAAHDEAIQLFEKAAREGCDPELRAFAEKTLPALRKHRAELDTIQLPH